MPNSVSCKVKSGQTTIDKIQASVKDDLMRAKLNGLLQFRGSSCMSSSRPLAIGAGAGSLSSLVLTLLSQHVLRPPDPVASFERFIPECPEGEVQRLFLLGLLLGILIGIILGGLLDLLYLLKQRLTVEVRDRIASLHLKRG